MINPVNPAHHEQVQIDWLDHRQRRQLGGERIAVHRRAAEGDDEVEQGGLDEQRVRVGMRVYGLFYVASFT